MVKELLHHLGQVVFPKREEYRAVVVLPRGGFLVSPYPIPAKDLEEASSLLRERVQHGDQLEPYYALACVKSGGLVLAPGEHPPQVVGEQAGEEVNRVIRVLRQATGRDFNYSAIVALVELVDLPKEQQQQVVDFLRLADYLHPDQPSLRD